MKTQFTTQLNAQLAELEAQGLFKSERYITSPQGAEIQVNGRTVLDFCANNYLGLANHPTLIAAAKHALDTHGFGMASVRFICGTQDLHKQLEQKLSDFLGMEDTILYSSCFDANGGLFETLFGEEDAIISDELNHASIIDGIRLCKAKRWRYKNSDMADLKAKLIEAKECRYRLIATDGIFSMDGYIAKLKEICDLADEHDALVMVDDSHAVGFMGKNGRGTHEHCEVMGRIDILTGTLGKALGGASGGYTSGKKEVISWLRNRSRPYLFSNALAPSITGAAMATLDLLASNHQLLDKLRANSARFRAGMSKAGFDLLPGEHPIIPVMLYDAKLARDFSNRLLQEGIYVVGFSYPVVPQGKARIRTQMSAAHSFEQIDAAIAAFTKVGKELKVI